MNDSERARRRLGRTCLLLVVLLLAGSIPLRCVGAAFQVGGVSALDGALFGLALAGVTRTRRAGLIYLFLLAAVGLLAPLWQEWPPADQDAVFLPSGAPEILRNYLDVLRYGLFALALPYPFARFGFHAPDPIAHNGLCETASASESSSAGTEARSESATGQELKSGWENRGNQPGADAS